jgi:putative PIN family toxin of toxin-antitoxin system
MARVVLDTNVLVSAFLKKGKSRNLVESLLENHDVILSSQMMAELADVLSRNKFNIKSDQIDRYMAILIRKAIIVSVKSSLKIVPEDPDDDIVLNTALSGQADYIVSGDKHLHKLVKYENIQIVSVSDFYQKTLKVK